MAERTRKPPSRSVGKVSAPPCDCPLQCLRHDARIPRTVQQLRSSRRSHVFRDHFKDARPGHEVSGGLYSAGGPLLS